MAYIGCEWERLQWFASAHSESCEVDIDEGRNADASVELLRPSEMQASEGEVMVQ
jgi:hypothetical protein